MKVILLQDVKALGKKGEIVEVSDGYARNKILPGKLGVEANGKNLNDLKLQNKHAEKVAADNLANAKKAAEDLKDKVVKLTLKTGKDGQAFGSISTKEIAAEAKKQLGIDIDKKKMVLDVPIKACGTYNVKIKLHSQVSGELKVQVTEE
jgi:large subunit ribosomal protein L9